MFREYQRFCNEHGFALIGRTEDDEAKGRAGEDNRAMLARYPALARWEGFLTGLTPGWKAEGRTTPRLVAGEGAGS